MRWALLYLAAACPVVAAAAGPTVLEAGDFGIVADGTTDDGPAIAAMVMKARELNGAPVTLRFPPERVVFAATGDGSRYLFPLERTKNITLDGGGTTFLLDPRLRMVDLDHAVAPVVRNLNIDYTPHPFIETTIEAVDPMRAFVDVKPLHLGETGDLGGPTKEDGEQAFIGFVWCENGPRPKAATHFTVKAVELLGAGRARVFFDGAAFPKRSLADRIRPGETRFSVPRPGVAHRHGPGPLFRIHDTVDAKLESIHVWGAPWFTFSVYRNEGTLTFTDVDVVPKPGSDRLMAGGRDAFHVTGNRATMLFDGCDTAGLGDDDYNFCVLSASVRKVLSPTRIVIRQKFPIQYNPMRAGETLMVMDDQNTMLGGAVIATCEETPLKDNEPIVDGGRCPEVTLTLKTPIAGMAEGLHVWAKEAANPNTTMRNCSVNFSCRMQTSLVIEHCRLNCYNVSYGMSPTNPNVEGPGPEFMKISDSVFTVGRGSGYRATCGGDGGVVRCRIQDVTIENCVFKAPLSLMRARRITLRNNKFHDAVTIGDCAELRMTGNEKDGAAFEIRRAESRGLD